MIEIKPATFKVLLVIWGIILLTLHFIAAVTNTGMLWGVDSWAYFPIRWVVLLTVLGTLILFPKTEVFVSSALVTLKNSLPVIFVSRIVRYSILPGMIVLAGLVFGLFRCRTHLLGDGYLLLRSFEQGSHFISNAPLFLQLTDLLKKFTSHFLEFSVRNAFQVMSITSGMFFVLFLFILSRRLGKQIEERVLIFLGIITLGLIQLFFGYVETYPPLSPLLLFYIYSSVRLLKSQDSLVVPLTIFWLLILLHLTALSLAPSALYLGFRWWESRESAGRVRTLVSNLILPVLLVVFFAQLIGLDFRLLFMRVEGTTPPFIPLIENDSVSFNYSLFSVDHLVSLFNLVLLAAPFFFPFCLLLFRSNRQPPAPVFIFLLLASIFPLIALFLFNPELGFPRDWDVFAYVFIPPMLLGLLLLIELAGESRALLRYSTVVIAGLGLLHTVPWVLVNMDEKRSVQRYEHLFSPEFKLSKIAQSSGHEEAAIYYRDRNNYEKAIYHYQRALEAIHESFRLHLKVADLYQKTEQWEQEIAVLDSAVRLSPETAEAYYLRGNACEKIGRHGQAVSDFSRAIEINPDDPLYYYNRGLAYNNLGEYGHALEDFSRTIAIDILHVEAYNNRGNIYLLTGNHELAVRDYEKAIELNPQHIEAYYNRGLAYYDLGRYQMAIKDLSKTLELDPNYANAYLYLGVINLSLGKSQQAFSNFTRALSIDPGNETYYITRGQAFQQQGKPQLAVEDFTRALELSPENGKTYYLRGICYLDTGNPLLARRDFETALRLGIEKAREFLK